ncbi:ABC transporter permease (plasmid) [Haloferacaceae archaeon DSL9]
MSINISPDTFSIGDKVNVRQVSKYGPVIGLLGIFAFFSIAAEAFLTGRNIINLLRQISIIGVLAIASTFPILCSEIDLSIAQMMEVSGMIIAALATGAIVAQSLPVPVAIAAGFVIAISLGGISGFITSQFDVPSFMTTLAMLFLADGLSLLVSGNRPITGLPETLTMFGRGSVFGLPTIAIIFVVLLITSQFVLSYTRFGLYVYAVGGNREATELVGINVKRVRMGVLVISASFTVIAAILMMGRVNYADPTMGAGLLLPPIAAVILGGANLFGGSGNMLGTLIGVLILGVLTNGLNLMGVSPAGQLVAQGIVLMLAVIANVIGRNR